uniref:Uncharacterized protein n=1 Tax=Oryza glaberrima TaxID=4538 RepID=I1PI12_ORYGL
TSRVRLATEIVASNTGRRSLRWPNSTTMLEIKKDRAVEALRGREVWFNSYLRSCCTAMAGVCRELRVPRGVPEESAAGYILWLNGACAQLDGIGKCIDEALK